MSQSFELMKEYRKMSLESELAKRIAAGHAKTHWPHLSDADLGLKIQSVLEGFARSHPIGPTAGRKIYQAADGTTVIVDPTHPDGGTAFVPYPKPPLQYFKDLWMITNEGKLTMNANTNVTLNQAELKVLRRVLNALNSVPFHKTEKPIHDFVACEKYARSLVAPAYITNADELETMLYAIDAVTAEFSDSHALQLYVGNDYEEILNVKTKIEAQIHMPV
jgi:hypothetical protein